MMYTTIPAALVALVLFTAAGLMHSGGEMDTTRANLICDTLAEHFNLNPILILPAILVLLVSVFKLPALLVWASLWWSASCSPWYFRE